MNRLHELAQRLGVETHRPFHFHTQIHDGQGDYAPLMVLRPDKDIAHDMLAKLSSARYELAWENDEHGAPHWYLMDIYMCDCTKHAAFEEAVCALAERHLEQKS